MSPFDPATAARLRAGLPPLEPSTELVFRPEGDRPVAMLRPVGAPPRAFVLDGDAVRELHLAGDAELPAAALFADDAALLAALRPALGQLAEPRLVAWRPGRRAVVRLRRGEEVLFVKFLDRKTYKRAKATFATLPAAPAPLVFARATQLLPEHFAYVAPCVPGMSLRDHLGRGIAPSWPLVDAAVQALAATPVTADMPQHDFAAARAAAVKMLRKAEHLEPELRELADRTAELAAPTSARTGFVHGDLHDKQIFLAGNAAHLIDLEGVGRGDPVFDLVNLAEHLRLRALQQAGTDDGSAEALLERIGVDADARCRWRLTVRARLCGVYALRPRWSALTRQLLAESRKLLANIE